MNLLELTKLDINDLKNLDKKKLLEDLLKSPEQLVIGLTLLISLLTGFFFYHKSQASTRDLSSEVTALRKKIEAVEAYRKANSELKAFRDQLPISVSSEELLSLMTQLAGDLNLPLKNLKPDSVKTLDTHTQATVQVELEIEDFNKLWDFLAAIETAPYALRIDSLQILPRLSLAQNNAQTQQIQKRAPLLEVRLVVSGIQFTSEEKK